LQFIFFCPDPGAASVVDQKLLILDSKLILDPKPTF
jgi:hypothetical protein